MSEWDKFVEEQLKNPEVRAEYDTLKSDDTLTDEDIADIEQARAEFARGEAITASVINWN